MCTLILFLLFVFWYIQMSCLLFFPTYFLLSLHHFVRVGLFFCTNNLSDSRSFRYKKKFPNQKSNFSPQWSHVCRSDTVKVTEILFFHAIQIYHPDIHLLSLVYENQQSCPQKCFCNEWQTFSIKKNKTTIF